MKRTFRIQITVIKVIHRTHIVHVMYEIIRLQLSDLKWFNERNEMVCVRDEAIRETDGMLDLLEMCLL